MAQMVRHEELPIPIHSSLEEVYGDSSQLEEAQLRFHRLKTKFQQVFGHPPQLCARSPGLYSLHVALSIFVIVCLPESELIL